MEPSEHLRQIVAQLAGLTPDAISPDFSMKSRGLQSSVRRAALSAAIRRQLGRNIAEAYTANTFGELQAAIEGTANLNPTAARMVDTPKPFVSPATLGTDGLACGIDIEMVAALPSTEDYWEHEFYKEHFSHDEIAYCVLQENPRMHFAARWCAKEALLKCDPSFNGHSLATVEVIRAPSGEITLAQRINGSSHKLPLAVSISHTDAMAIAIVVRRSA
jgi:phosphopantetheine--protein transferase-like protein